MTRSDWLEEELIARALAGDTEEARYALERCAEGVLMGTLSARMRTYLHDRLREVVEGTEPARALRIARPGAGRPVAEREWEVPLAALAALLHQRKRSAETIIDLMSQARQITEGKGLSRTQAQRIRHDWEDMRTADGALLEHIMLHRRPAGTADEPRSLGSLPRFSEANALALLALLNPE